ncbi:MAG: flagellar hook-length control protein FliK [Zoogloeaceae bacterium]|jgi:hypothetical protein|nr:flagellar hook-length control protein FliK [Zoogloeaceae bacterium]
MIPADVASRVRLASDLTTQPAQKIADALSDFVPGQRVMAMIQALLPNGTYRAMIAQQREITLALPFAAKPGDALELEVVDTDGKLAFAIATRKETAAAAQNASVATRLTVTGQLIAELLADIDKEGGKRPDPAPLNNAQPVVNRFPQNAADLAPALRMALARSGMFYEAHQAQWAQGKTALADLLQEPQGRLSPAAHIAQAGGQIGGQSATAQAQSPAGQAGQTAQSAQASASSPNVQTAQASATPQTPQATAAQASASAAQAGRTGAAEVAAQQAIRGGATGEGAARIGEEAVRVGMGRVVANELTGLVRQQLEALATHSYVWQGQIWPGQTLEWEIVDEDGGKREQEENTAANWTTRLSLTLPRLGGVGATLRLSGGREIEITLKTENETTRQTLFAANALLQQQFETAGLKLKSFAIARPAGADEPAA